MACETMEQLEFSIKPEEKIINLSHAEKRMVEIAKAFHTRPSIMILDEPTASLAENETNHLFSMIEILKSEGNTDWSAAAGGKDPDVYATSKLAMTILAFELHRRYDGRILTMP